jgi:hypothetical protein
MKYVVMFMLLLTLNGAIGFDDPQLIARERTEQTILFGGWGEWVDW